MTEDQRLRLDLMLLNLRKAMILLYFSCCAALKRYPILNFVQTSNSARSQHACEGRENSRKRGEAGVSRSVRCRPLPGNHRYIAGVQYEQEDRARLQVPSVWLLVHLRGGPKVLLPALPRVHQEGLPSKCCCLDTSRGCKHDLSDRRLYMIDHKCASFTGTFPSFFVKFLFITAWGTKRAIWLPQADFFFFFCVLILPLRETSFLPSLLGEKSVLFTFFPVKFIYLVMSLKDKKDNLMRLYRTQSNRAFYAYSLPSWLMLSDGKPPFPWQLRVEFEHWFDVWLYKFQDLSLSFFSIS